MWVVSIDSYMVSGREWKVWLTRGPTEGSVYLYECPLDIDMYLRRGRGRKGFEQHIYSTLTSKLPQLLALSMADIHRP